MKNIKNDKKENNLKENKIALSLENSKIKKSYLDFLILSEKNLLVSLFTKKRNFRKILKTRLITIIVKSI